MLSIISSTFYNVLSNLPKLQLDSSENMLRKVNKLALPAILLLGSQAIQIVDAIGCIGCFVCLAGGGSPLCIPICVICGVTIPVPAG